jgi:hypothetical protein
MGTCPAQIFFKLSVSNQLRVHARIDLNPKSLHRLTAHKITRENLKMITLYKVGFFLASELLEHPYNRKGRSMLAKPCEELVVVSLMLIFVSAVGAIISGTPPFVEQCCS